MFLCSESCVWLEVFIIRIDRKLPRRPRRRRRRTFRLISARSQWGRSQGKGMISPLIGLGKWFNIIIINCSRSTWFNYIGRESLLACQLARDPTRNPFFFFVFFKLLLLELITLSWFQFFYGCSIGSCCWIFKQNWIIQKGQGEMEKFN